MRQRDQRRARRGRRGFTLIEIMAVVIIMGLLAGIVGVAIFGQLDTARVNTTRTQMKQLEAALSFYQMDNGRFPTTEQGLRALIEPPTIGPEPRNYRPGGYLQGREVLHHPTGGASRITLDVAAMGAGTYLLCTDGRTPQVARFVVE